MPGTGPGDMAVLIPTLEPRSGVWGGQEKVQNGPILGKRKYLCKGKSGSLYTRVRIHVSCGWWVCEWFLFLYDFLGFYTDFNRTILNLFETYWGNIGQ